MLPLGLHQKPGTLHVLCIGAHSDDIEIGCAATLLGLIERGHGLRVDWVVLCAPGERAAEARRSAEALLGSTAEALLGRRAELRVHLAEFRDAYFPAEFGPLKEHLAGLRRQIDPDLVFTHNLDDRHQDHRLVAELTWQAWRDHLVLEYEVPKYEGDLVRPNFFAPASRALAQAKVEHLLEHFGSQRSKDWFTSETFLGLMRVRGVECRAAEGLAEAFVARKLVL
jgi:LmbE family N-acetylglucosaminyl deacetylase